MTNYILTCITVMFIIGVILMVRRLRYEYKMKPVVKLLRSLLTYREYTINGICYQVHKKYPDTDLKQHFKTWPHYSGEVNYPIADPTGVESNKMYFMHNNLWTGVQLKQRQSLIRHIIKEMS